MSTRSVLLATTNTVEDARLSNNGSDSESSWQGLEKLFASVLDPQTRDNHQRHFALAKHVIYQNEQGWKLSELPVASDFVQLLSDKVADGFVQFTDLLLAAITLCAKPFVRLKSNEEISNPMLLHSLLQTLAQLLTFEQLDVQVAAAETLLQFAIGACLARPIKVRSNNVEPNIDDLRLSSRVFSQNVMEETGVIDAVVGVLYDLFPDNSNNDEPDERVRYFDEFGALNPEQLDSTVASDQSLQRSLESCPPSSAASERLLIGAPATSSTPSTPIHSVREATPSTSLRVNEDKSTTVDDEQPLTADGSQLNASSAITTLTLEQRSAAVLFTIVEIVYELSSHQRCAEVLVLSGALHHVVFILASINDPHDELLSLCVVVLWNVLELCHEKMRAVTKCASRRELLVHFRLRNAAYFLTNEFTLVALLHVLELLLARGYRQQDKELRNECLMVLTLLARRRRSLDVFYSTGVTNCLLSYATAAETQQKRKLPKVPALFTETTGSGTAKLQSSARAVAINADHRNYATNSDVDFEFKQMLWFLLAEVVSDHDANRQEFVQFRFAEILLGYATGGWATSQPAASTQQQQQHHTPAQLQALQVTALSVLNHVAPSIVDHFIEMNGHAVLLEYLESSVLQTDENLAEAWMLLLQLASPMPSVQDELGRIGAVEVAVTAFAAPPSRHTFGIRRNALLACANMCRGHDVNRRRFRDAHGVHVVLQHLAFDPSYSVLEENILVAIVDAIRSCIVGDADSESAFIDDDGAPKLLAVLESVPLKAVKNQVLAALAEVCVNPSAIPSFLSWRSDQRETNNFTATQLLLRIYANEDAVDEQRARSIGKNNDDTTDDAVVSLAHARQSAFKSVTTCRNPFIVSTHMSDDSGLESLRSDMMNGVGTANSERPQSPAFARLKDALRAAQSGRANRASTNTSLLELRDADSHPDVNLKAKIYAVLANVSFATSAADVSALSARDLVMLEIAKEYPTFQVGEMWQNVHVALHAEGIRPIYADALYIRRHLEHAYNLSVCTKHAQRAITQRAYNTDVALENALYVELLRQKREEAQAEAFHRASLQHNSTFQLHLDAKRTRLEFLRREDPTAFAALASSAAATLKDPAPVCDCSDLNTLAEKEAELRGRLGTITQRK